MVNNKISIEFSEKVSRRHLRIGVQDVVAIVMNPKFTFEFSYHGSEALHEKFTFPLEKGAGGSWI